jgi:DNA polymerase
MTDSPSDSPAALAADLRRALLDNEGELAYWGERFVAASPVAATSPAPAPSTAASPAPASSTAASDARPVANAAVNASKAERLRLLFEQEIGDCHRCPLGDTRIKLVFGVGNPEARVMFVGEGPGYDEDRKGEPFVGRAGQLLDKIIASIGLDRTKAYIANVAKCHPMKEPSTPDARGNDRPPTPEEMSACLPFLKKQIEIIRPEIVVSLGATAAKGLLGNIGGITSIRGKLFSITLDDGTVIPVLPTFHPAALLRDPELKKPVWDDMKQLRDRLGLPPAQR